MCKIDVQDPRSDAGVFPKLRDRLRTIEKSACRQTCQGIRGRKRKIKDKNEVRAEGAERIR
jgi:hypothetical protein